MIDMYPSLQLPVAATSLPLGLQNTKFPQSSHCKGTPKSSRNSGLFLIVGKKTSTDKEAEVSYARSTRALPMRLVTVRKSLDSGAQAVVDEYVSKVKRYCSFEELQIRPNPKNTSDVSAQVEAEAERVLRSITTKDWVVLVDERGQDLTSEQFATSIAEAGDKGASALVFCIGGPYGHGSQVRKRANVSVKLSSMVLNHQVAMIVLLEQIYRAWTILRGEKYHH
ncbi:unnamed protein product [Calypogeia fissa]